MNWNYIRLEEIADFRNGVNFTSDSFGTGIKVINVGDFKDKMYPDYEELGELDSEANWSKECFLKENDIVFVRSNGNKNLIGRSIFIKNLPVDKQVTYSAFSIRLRFKKLENICPEFYLYLFKSPLFRGVLSQYGNGTNISNLNQDILNNMPIPTPPLPIQQKIASILSAYDELIENNKQRIKLLEEMAEEIYKEWFVRLRFPNYENTEFLDGLPLGWVKGKIGDICTVGRGSSPRPITEQKYFDDGTIPWIKIADATASSKFILKTKEYVNEFGASFSRYLDEDSLIIATSGTLGFCMFLGLKGCIHDGWLYTYNYTKGIKPSYLYFKINSLKEYFDNMSYGAAIQNINTEILRKTPILIPNEDILSKFYSIISPIDDEHKILLQKNQLLQQTRDLLLPRLISGKLSVAGLLENKVYKIGENEEHLSMAAEDETVYGLTN